MKLYDFTFYFDGGSLTVRAFTYKEAEKFARGESLARGWGYEVIGCDGPIEVATEDTFAIEIPSWCKIGTRIKWYNPDITGCDWVFERIISYGYDGFFHQARNCPVYYTKFSEYGKTVRLEEELI